MSRETVHSALAASDGPPPKIPKLKVGLKECRVWGF